MKPERGGNPARERRVIGTVALRSGFLVHEVASLFKLEASGGVRERKVVDVSRMYI
jgi:hypothetical protein